MTRILAHAHSTWSHDGHLALGAYIDIARARGCGVVLLSEHEESGWDDERWAAYVRTCDTLSTRDVRLVPGIEFLQDGCHVLCYGLQHLPARPSSASDLAADVHAQGCILTLAHPGKYQWRIPAALLESVDAVEIWNSKWIYDGAAGPHLASRRLAVEKLALVGQDVHKPKHLSSLLLVTESDDVLADLALGRYGVAWGDRYWSPAAWYSELGVTALDDMRARAYHIWIRAALKAYRTVHRPLHALTPRASASASVSTSASTSTRLQRLTSDTPMVSVILPIRNEQDYIVHALQSVLAQDYPADRLEIIVADGRSTDRTFETVATIAEYPEARGRLRLIDNAGQIVSTGLNAALAFAAGDVIVRIDGHCDVPSDFVRRAVAHLVQDDVDCVGGVLDTIGDTRMARIIAAAMSARFGVGGSAFRAGSPVAMLTDTVAFPAFTRRAIDRTGLFDEELVRNQDDEYSYRLRRLGGRILLATDMPARYYSRGTLGSLWRQCRQYGYWKVRVLQKHPRQMRARQFVPALFVFALAGSLALTAVRPALWPLAALVSGTYVAAACAAAWRERRARGWGVAAGLPLAFATMHLAYGAGFLIGLAAFWRGWRSFGHAAHQQRRVA